MRKLLYSLHLDAGVLEEVRKRAVAAGVTPSAWVRDAIQESLDTAKHVENVERAVADDLGELPGLQFVEKKPPLGTSPTGRTADKPQVEGKKGVSKASQFW